MLLIGNGISDETGSRVTMLTGMSADLLVLGVVMLSSFLMPAMMKEAATRVILMPGIPLHVWHPKQPCPCHFSTFCAGVDDAGRLRQA
jgi:hypothetical protein